VLVVFGSVQRVMRAERSAREAGLDVDVVPAPRTVSSECGVVLEARADEAGRLADICAAHQWAPSVFRLSHGAWLPSSFETAAGARSVALTRGSAYGGCGAKLSKGLLTTVLCGLPRLESDDLLVGIELADDAGVVRVSADLALIHTVDFFPPIVDDPFSFGRIAAVNALSDVYAMGGTPVAGMNLVSFPLAELDRSVLKEILRGGMEALAEANAVLAGGHTVEGQELLYGMAVTGRVRPDAIWRNLGAEDGDALVLTKPLGTGVVTTAASAELARAEDLATAIRWMGTLNRGAAEAVAEIGPHAVTDVTGFGLVGHAAEMAAAGGVELEIALSSLPLLPGSYEGAAQGLVPAGTAKNRDSTRGVLAVPADADPVLVDLACDPQTSGGLLVSCAESDAEQLVRRLPGSAVVGRVTARAPGTVRLV
jgi:selenide,water dikinase